MKILAFDTSTTACSIALQNGAVIATSHQIAPMQQAKLILPLIDNLLADQGLTLRDLDAIAYGAGPGSFTGIRIAASVAQGIGYAASLPIIRVSSLAAMAQTAFLEKQWDKCLVAVDARTEQIYWGIYKVNAHGCMELEGDEQVGTPQEVKYPNDTTYYGIGDGWAKYTDKLEAHLGFKPKAINETQLPTAQALLRLAQVKFSQQKQIAAFEAIPVYLR